MNELQIFNNAEFGEVRTVVKDNEPWFVAADVCEFFGVTNRNRVLQNLDEDEKGGTQIDTPGGVQTVTIINEAGLYTLLFYLQPTKARGVSDEYIAARCEQLRKYKRWITHEVIPSIRKHGAYITTEAAEKIMNDPDNWIKLLTALKEEREGKAIAEAKCAALESEKAQMAEELDLRKKQGVKYFILGSYYEQAIKTGTDITLTETAKEIGCGRNELIDLCLRKKYLYRSPSGRLLPYANRTAKGVFSIKEYKYKGGYTLEPMIYVTIAGRAKLNAECISAGLVRPTLPDADIPVWELAEV
jgi:prophage antirepressor-like protein